MLEKEMHMDPLFPSIRVFSRMIREATVGVEAGLVEDRTPTPTPWFLANTQSVISNTPRRKLLKMQA